MIAIVLYALLAVYVAGIVVTLLCGALLMLAAGVLAGWSVLIRRVRARYEWRAQFAPPDPSMVIGIDVSKWSGPDVTVRQIDLPDGRSIVTRVTNSRTTIDKL